MVAQLFSAHARNRGVEAATGDLLVSEGIHHATIGMLSLLIMTGNFMHGAELARLSLAVHRKGMVMP